MKKHENLVGKIRAKMAIFSKSLIFRGVFGVFNGFSLILMILRVLRGFLLRIEAFIAIDVISRD